MNCERIQQEILLSQTGELSELESDKLRLHLASCEQCRQYSKNTGEIMSLARASLPSEGPGSAAMARILAAAREEADRKVILYSLPSLKWALRAAAAALIICGAAVWSFRLQPITPAGQMSAIVMAVGSEENLNVISRSGKTAKDQELQALASHLLIMEGFVADEMQEIEVIDVVDEPRPTALQSHSIDASELQRCV